MSADLLSILIVVSLGLFFGTGAGLLLGYLLKVQERDWRRMSRRQILINAGLILVCSAGIITALAWYAFLRS